MQFFQLPAQSKTYKTRYIFLTHADDLLCLQLYTVESRFFHTFNTTMLLVMQSTRAHCILCTDRRLQKS